MKKTKNLIISFCFVMFLSVFLISCEQASFNSTPWAASGKTCSEISNDVDDSIYLMMNEIHIPITYVTTTNFKFSNTQDGSFSAKTVQQITTSSFSSSSTSNATAKFVTETREDGVLVSIKEVTYVRVASDEGLIYTQITHFPVSESGKETVFRDRQKAQIIDITFKNLLSEIIFVLNEDEAETALEKTFEEIKYYQLNLSADNLENIQKRFVEKSDLFDAPELFAIEQKDEHYVLPFSVEYGLTNTSYVNYFAINYSVANSNLLDGRNWETYLTVSSTTRLKSYGSEMTLPTPPDSVDDFTAATFDNVVKSSEFFVEYEEMPAEGDGDGYVKYKVQTKKDSNMLVEVERKENGTSGVTRDYYYITPTNDGYEVFEVNITNKTYAPSSLSASDFPFLKFNYSLAFHTTTSSGDYQYGNGANIYLLMLLSGEIHSIADGKTAGSTQLLIKIFDVGISDLFLNFGVISPAAGQ